MCFSKDSKKEIYLYGANFEGIMASHSSINNFFNLKIKKNDTSLESLKINKPRKIPVCIYSNQYTESTLPKCA